MSGSFRQLQANASLKAPTKPGAMWKLNILATFQFILPGPFPVRLGALSVIRSPVANPQPCRGTGQYGTQRCEDPTWQTTVRSFATLEIV